MLNTHTQISYVTYGTEKEVTQVLEEATVSWNRKLNPSKLRGAAWRDQTKMEVAKQHETHTSHTNGDADGTPRKDRDP